MDQFVKKAVAKPGAGRIGIILRTSRPLAKTETQQLAKVGGYVYRNLPIIDAVAVNVPERKLASLFKYSFVKHASADATVRKSDVFTVGASGASLAWERYGATGKGVGIAVLDSGIRRSRDFGVTSLDSRIVLQTNYSPDVKLTTDLSGHGTHVAGIIGGNGANSSGRGYFQTHFGIAPEANLINVRVLDANGVGTVSQVISGIGFVIAKRSKYNIRVLNLSVSHPAGESYQVDPLCRAVEQAWRVGIVVICVAGNNGRANAEATEGLDNEGFGTNYASIDSPGNSPAVITVGAMKQIDGNRANDTIATYSGRGPTRHDFFVKPDLVAPGNQIISTLAPDSTIDRMYRATHGVPWQSYMNTTQTGMSTDYFKMSGTSMAAPVVAGAVALMLELDPKINPNTVKARLMLTADKWVGKDGKPDIFTYGAGYLNIPAALQSTIKAQKITNSPVAIRHADGNIEVDILKMYGYNSIWGTGAKTGQQVWGDRAMWGKNGGLVSGDRAMWGKDFWFDTNYQSITKAGIDLSEIGLKGDKN
jgi:serine protease AprX